MNEQTFNEDTPYHLKELFHLGSSFHSMNRAGELRALTMLQFKKKLLLVCKKTFHIKINLTILLQWRSSRSTMKIEDVAVRFICYIK